VRTCADRDALLQGAVKPFGEFGQTEILDDRKSLGVQYVG
jgi:hypothetical protein